LDEESRVEIGTGILQYEAVCASISSIPQKRKYVTFSDEEKQKIGKYAVIHGNASAARKYGVGESTVRHHRKNYEKALRSSKPIPKAKRGRPLLLGPTIDETVIKYLNAIRKKGGVVNTVVAIAVATALISKSNDESLKSLNLERTNWAKSLFKRMGFVKRCATTGKPPIPDGAKKEAGLLFHHQIVKFVEDHDIPPSLILNFDQTPLKFAPVSSQTLAKQGTKHVNISGVTYRKALTATFGITLSNEFLPIQLIYGGKTVQSLPKVNFPESFSLSVNEKHFSNTEESLKLIEEIINPYVQKERKRLERNPSQMALLIIDVFRGQMTEPVLNVLKESNICLVKVPANMTDIYQPLDLTVNRSAKAFFKKKFTHWYSEQIQNEFDKGKDIDEIEVKLSLTVLKPLHAAWIKEYYDHMTSENGKPVIKNGWKASGITNAIEMGLSKLPSIDPFSDIDPLISEPSLNTNDAPIPEEEIIARGYARESECESDDEWESVVAGEGEMRSAFDLFNDISDDEE